MDVNKQLKYDMKARGKLIKGLIEDLQYDAIERGINVDSEVANLLNIWENDKDNARRIANIKQPVTETLMEVPTRFSSIVDDCGKNNDWYTYDQLGTGLAGTVYTVCWVDDCEYVLKKQPTGKRETALRNILETYVEVDSFRHEVKALIDLQGWKHIPRIYAAWTCGDWGYIVMEKLDTYYEEGERSTEIAVRVEKVLTELYLMKWIHSDAHRGNVMCRGNGDIVLIDYGRARKFKDSNDISFSDDHPWTILTGKRITPSEMFDVQISNMKQVFSYFVPNAIEDMYNVKEFPDTGGLPNINDMV